MRNSGDPAIGQYCFNIGDSGEVFSESQKTNGRKSDKIIVVRKPVNKVSKTML